MKGTNATLITHFEGEVTTVAGLWKIVRTDSTVLGFTDHPTNLVYDGVTYYASSGFSRSAVSDKDGLSVDNLDIMGLFDSSLITAEDLRKGKYRGAAVYYSECNYTDDPIVNIHKLEYGLIGEITVKDSTFIAEFRSITQLLDATVGSKYGRYCRATLGDADCGIDLDAPTDWAASTAYAVGDFVSPTTYDARRYECTTAGTSGGSEPTWNTTVDATTSDNTVTWTCREAWTKIGEVDTVTSRSQFTDTTLNQANNWYRSGVLTWTSGDNNGLAVDVKTSTAAGVITLKFAMPYDIAVGDDYTITAGCNHLLKASSDEWGTTYTGDCIAKFSNSVNFRGEPDIPNNDAILAGSQ